MSSCFVSHNEIPTYHCLDVCSHVLSVLKALTTALFLIFNHKAWLSRELIRLSLFFRNRSIADYLRSNGYEEAYSVFKKEAELDMVSVGTPIHLNLSQTNISSFEVFPF